MLAALNTKHLVFDHEEPNLHALAWAANGTIQKIHCHMKGSSHVMLLAGFSKITSPLWRQSAESNNLARSCSVADSCKMSCSWIEFEGNPLQELRCAELSFWQMLEDARFRGLQRSLHPCFAKNERCSRVGTELTVDPRSDSISVGKKN